MQRREIHMRQGGERVYVTPVSLSIDHYLTINNATQSIKAFFLALFALFKAGTTVVYGEAERPYCVGRFDPTLTFNKHSYVDHILVVLWRLVLEVVLFTRVLLDVRSWWQLKYVFHTYRNSTLTAGSVYQTHVSVYGYMLVNYNEGANLVANCYLDVADSVVTEDLMSHRDYDFHAEKATYDDDRGVFMVLQGDDFVAMLDWINAHTGENQILTYLRHVDT